MIGNWHYLLNLNSKRRRNEFQYENNKNIYAGFNEELRL